MKFNVIMKYRLEEKFAGRLFHLLRELNPHIKAVFRC